MAAISANLLAAAAPSLSRLLNLAAQTAGTTQPALVTGFANFLTQATATATTTTGTGSTTTATNTEADTETTDTSAGSEVAASVLAAIGLVPQQLPTQLPPVTADATGTAPRQSLASSIPLDPAVNLAAPTTDRTSSRSVELQLNTAPLTPGSPVTTPILTQAAPTEPAGELPTLPEPTTDPTPSLPAGTPVAATPGEVVAAASRPPAVAPQAPLVVDRSQLLPAQPAEIGYGLVGPTVNGPPAVTPVPAVGGTPSQAQVEQIATTLPAVEPTPPPTPADTAAPVQPFSRVLASETSAPAPDTTAPVPQVVTAPPPVTPQPVASTATEPTLFASQPAPQKTPLDTPPAKVTESVPRTVPRVTHDTPSVSETVPGVAFTPTAPAPTSLPAVIEMREPIATVEVEQPQIAALSANSIPAEPTPAAAPPRVAPNAPPVASQLSDAFVTHARVIESGGTHEFQLRLDPPELGEVKVRVLAMGDRIEARLVVSDDAVKRLIESQLPELRQRLEAAGVNVPTFDVSTDGGGKRADTGGDGWDRSQPALAPTRRPAGPTRLTPPRPNAPGGLLDVTA